jgi:hypothetical protein
MCILYDFVSSHAKNRAAPYQTPGHDLCQFCHPARRRAPSSDGRRKARATAIERDAALFRVFLKIVLALAEARALPWLHRARSQRLCRVGDDEPVVEADHAAEAAAGLAGAERRVEREQTRRWIPIVDVAIRAVQIGRKAPGGRRRCSGGIVRAVGDVNVDAALADAQRRLDRVHHACAIDTGHPEPVLDDGQPIAVARLDARIALRFEQCPHFGFGVVRRHRDGKRHYQPRIAGRGAAPRQFRVDRRRRVARDRAPAAAAVQRRGTRIEHFQVIGKLGHRADGRARRAHRIRLVDRDRRRNAIDAVDLRLVHAVEELPRVRRERLDVTALPFGIQRVEDER